MENNKNPHETTIIVNATPHEWPKKEITYTEVVHIAYPDAEVNESSTHKVSYKYKNESTLKPLVYSSAPVKIKKDMVFNVALANRA